MKQIAIPAFLHEAFGERQDIREFVLIFVIGIGATALLLLVHPQAVSGLSVWRAALAALLILDVFAGCIANFTRGTNNYYAVRPTARRVFIAIHLHLPAVALLLGVAFVPALMVWAYTISGAVLVNSLKDSRHQRFIGGALFAFGLFAAPQFVGFPIYMLVVAQMFMLKVLFAFSVDHYGETQPGD